MSRATAAIFAFMSVAACQPDETLTVYGGEGIWHLNRINGQEFDASASIELHNNGKITGQGPCNHFQGTVAVPYPWFKVDNLQITGMACEDMSQETQFWVALTSMELVEISGTTLILSNEAEEEMIFSKVK